MANYDDDYNNNNDTPRRSGSVEQAKSKTQLPGILLIIMGVMALILGAISGVASTGEFQQGFEAGIKQQVEIVEKNAQLSPEQKKTQIDAINRFSDAFKQSLPNLLVYAIVAGVAGLFMILGGVKFMNLGSKGLVIFGSILAMTPFTFACCCIIGLPVGIWVLIALNNQVVRDGYAIKARRANSRYEE